MNIADLCELIWSFSLSAITVVTVILSFDLFQVFYNSRIVSFLSKAEQRLWPFLMNFQFLSFFLSLTSQLDLPNKMLFLSVFFPRLPLKEMRCTFTAIIQLHSPEHCMYCMSLTSLWKTLQLTPPQHRPLSHESLFPWRGSYHRCPPCWANLRASLFRTTRSEFRCQTTTLYICYSHINNPCYVGWLLVPDTEPQTAFLMRRLPLGLSCV